MNWLAAGVNWLAAGLDCLDAGLNWLAKTTKKFHKNFLISKMICTKIANK